MNIIGMDTHSATFTVGVMTSHGKLARCITRATSEKNLIDVVCEVQGERTVVIEENHLAQWVKTVLEPYVDRLVVSDPRQNRWIAKEEFIDDQKSAIRLAKLFQGGFI